MNVFYSIFYLTFIRFLNFYLFNFIYFFILQWIPKLTLKISGGQSELHMEIKKGGFKKPESIQ